jgi:hypothetical protein
VAVSVTGTAAVTAEVVAVKDPEEVPAPTVRVAGTLMAALLLERATLAPPGAAPESVTVQVLLAPPTTVAGVQLTEESVIPPTGGGGVMVMVADADEP